MSEDRPRVSIGMPLYNAEQYLAQTLESLLAQTVKDFELIISDNGSTDRTEDICRSYAARDTRVRYYREETNRGAAWNHNRVFELSSGEYFKWACYDDLCAPQFLEKCVAILDREPAVVLCCTKFMDIDDDGKFMRFKDSKASKLSESHARFSALAAKGHTCEEIYGLVRASILRTTSLIGPYTYSDAALLAELAFRGSFYEISEVLFYHRWHSASTYRLWPDSGKRWEWYDPSVKGRILFPWWTLFVAYLSVISRSRVSLAQHVRCYLRMIRWVRDWHRELWWETYWGVRALGMRFLKAHAPWLKAVHRALTGSQ